MSSTLAGVWMQAFIPGFLCVVALVTLSIWVGVLFSVSWLCGSARWVADVTATGKLAQTLSERWATPCLAVGVISGTLWICTASIVASNEVWLAGLALAVAVLLSVHSSVCLRARRIAGGRSGAIHGEGMNRLALVMSLALLTMLVSTHIRHP